jgi:DNA-binding SARP family transcriptional activator
VASKLEKMMGLRQQDERGPYWEALQGLFGSSLQLDLLNDTRWPLASLSHICGDALEAGINPDVVTELIKRRDLRPDGPDRLLWPWPVRIFTLGRFSLVKGDQAVVFTGKTPRKPLELLQALIALGGREVRVALVMRALWPEEDPRDLRKLFDNTLHRLRNILGHEETVMLRDGKLTIALHRCWVDAWAFDRLAGRYCDGEDIGPQGAESARQLYQGHFLQREADVPWLLPYRDRLRSRFHRFVLAHGRRLEQHGAWEAASEVYGQAIEVDNLSEILYRRLMTCRLHQGESAEALQVYRRCRELLSIVLGVKPSAETESIRLVLEGR